MAATAWNMKKWMNSFIHALFFSAYYWLLVLFAYRFIRPREFTLQWLAVKIPIRAEKLTN